MLLNWRTVTDNGTLARDLIQNAKMSRESSLCLNTFLKSPHISCRKSSPSTAHTHTHTHTHTHQHSHKNTHTHTHTHTSKARNRCAHIYTYIYISLSVSHTTP